MKGKTTLDVKVYIVTETGKLGCGIVAVKLTHSAARAYAKLGPGRKVERWVANKVMPLISTPTEQHPKEQHNGNHGPRLNRDRTLRIG